MCVSFQEVSNKKREGIRAKMAGKPRSVARIQDKTLQEMTDKGRNVQETGLVTAVLQLLIISQCLPTCN